MNPHHNLIHPGLGGGTPPRYRVILAYKNFAANKNISHIGLGVAGMNTSKVLRKHNAIVEVWPILDANHLRQLLNLSRSKLDSRINIPVTHVVVSAPWIEALAMNQLINLFPEVTFAVNCHSNVGFLQADSSGCRILRDSIELEKGVSNFHVAGNSKRFVKWVQAAYGAPCEYLPNLYYLDHSSPDFRPLFNGGTLRIGIFGATRPQKNFVTAIGAAIAISRELKVQTEVYLSGGRTEGGGNTIMRAAQELIGRLPQISLITNNWQTWPQFVQTVGNMHLLLQPSYTESFNMVTADGISRGVPSVVSNAIDWAPDYWQCENPDDTLEIARIGRQLITDTYSTRDGMEALESYVSMGVERWFNYFEGRQFGDRY